uniref:Putative bag family molecular chaperone regulator 3-like protein n=1 Tax=Ornithodoros turicata TaxID=34597 RepID=A0A2R5LN36_9ACAR
MSFRRAPFQFSDFNADDHRSELLRRFGFPPEQGSNNMFFESSTPSWNDWPGRLHRPFPNDSGWRNAGGVFSGAGGSAPGSPQTRMRNRGWLSSDEDGVPIKVVHEQADDCDSLSETSSQGSRSSTGSGRSGGSKLRHEPRVHHIPIMVEPRDGSSSSGYGSDGDGKQKAAETGASSPVNSIPSPKVSSPVEKKIHTIPIQVQGGDSAPGERLAKASISREGMHGEPRATPERNWANTFPRQKCQQVPNRTAPNATSKSASGGTIPSSGQRPGPSGRQNSKPTSPPTSPELSPPVSPQRSTSNTSKGPMTPEEAIRRINLELKDLTEQVNNFSGEPGDKQYRFLDEMLTRLMLRLDTIDPAGNELIRQMRKQAICDVQRVINRLEGRECQELVPLDDMVIVEADHNNADHVEPALVQPPMSPPPAASTDERSGFASFKGSSSNCVSSCNVCAIAVPGGPDSTEPMEDSRVGADGPVDVSVTLGETQVPQPADLTSSGEMLSANVDTTVTASGGEHDANLSQIDPDASSMVDMARCKSREDGVCTPFNENALSAASNMMEASSRDLSDYSMQESGYTDL